MHDLEVRPDVFESRDGRIHELAPVVGLEDSWSPEHEEDVQQMRSNLFGRLTLQSTDVHELR
jgi:hypothetical protein